ncbi:MAG: TlpA family protein disulfide reductase [Bacteroidota bacterium]
MKKLIFLLGLGAILFSCGEASTEESIVDENGEESSEIKQNLADNFEINGKIAGAVNQPLTLEAVSSKGTIQLASTTVGQDNSFVLKGNIQGMGMYQLRLGVTDTKIIPLTLAPKDKVTLAASYESFEILPVWSGTSWAKPLTDYMSNFNSFAVKQVELAKNAEKNKLTQEKQIAEFLKLRRPLDEFARNTMLNDPANPANIVLMTSLTPAMGYEYWDETYLEALKKVAVTYKAKYKDSPIAVSMLTQVKQIEAGLKDYKLTKSGQKAAPEIALKNPDGKVIKLSSLRGKVVLVDFWASWCGPCRKENPNVVNMYNKYKDKGFTVYSVSLDKDPEAWRRAIKADGLAWPNHVSDLLEWKTPLLDSYGFNSIPYTVLVGKDGKILGTNLRGASLEQKLKEVL